MLRLTSTDNNIDDRLRPIPFPRHRVAGRGADSGPRGFAEPTARNAGRMAERAVEDVQSRLDALDRLIDESFRFPDPDDDGPPSAA